jgi:hypothetical protein
MDAENFPSLEEIYRNVQEKVDANRELLRPESLGLSEEGREIGAVHVTDESAPDDEKETALIVCGRHGQELGTRVVGAALIDWLCSPEGAETRRRQRIVIVPVANPDGCVRGEFWAPRDGLSETEKKTIVALADRLQPDAVVDVHSWGDLQDGEAIITANTSGAGEDVFIHERLAGRMVEAAADRGYPFLLRRRPTSSSYNNFFCQVCYERFHSLVFGMEVNHAALTPRESAESGLAAITALLKEGDGRSSWQAMAGYPNNLLVGNFATSLGAAGSSASERRASRCEISKRRKSFSIPKRQFNPPDAYRVEFEYNGTEALARDVTVTCRVRGFPETGDVCLNDRPVEPMLHRDNCSTFLSVPLRPVTGERIVLSFKIA